jgi:Prenyltransferase and squalene oxidase repeat
VKRLLALALLTAILALPSLVSRAADEKTTVDTKAVAAMREKAIAFLRKSQSDDGSWSAKRAGPGITALVTAALIRSGLPNDDPTVAKGLKYLENSVKKDGGVYAKGLANYTTSVAILAFTDANKNGKYDTVIKNASVFLKKLQHDDKDVKLGGVGYDAKSRPDLSNTQFFIDALIASGVPKDDPAIKNALTFVSNCQNLPSEENTQPFAKKASEDDKGGLVYVPIDSDDNPHRTPAGGLRSQGAMTYAGLKSFLYAGVKKEDPRVKAALGWIRRHYTLEENPGLGQAGLYYYYHTFAKAMDAIGDAQFADDKGNKHDWRQELFDALKKRQTANGSFINAGDRAFGEQDPSLATAFALLSLAYVSPPR